MKAMQAQSRASEKRQKTRDRLISAVENAYNQIIMPQIESSAEDGDFEVSVHLDFEKIMKKGMDINEDRRWVLYFLKELLRIDGFKVSDDSSYSLDISWH